MRELERDGMCLPGNSRPPVHVASTSFNLREIADVHARDDSGNRPLHSAAFNQNPQIIEALIAAKADVNAGGVALQLLEGNHRMSDSDKEKVKRWLGTH